MDAWVLVHRSTLHLGGVTGLWLMLGRSLDPCSFQYICDEMLKANGIPLVKFPDTVVTQRKLKERHEKDKEDTRKRPRTSEEEGGGMEVDRGTRPREEVEGEESEYEYAIFPDGSWHLVPKGSVKYTPIPTPVTTPVSTPAPTPTSTPAHTPTTQMPKPLSTTHTPTPTPTPTPVASPKKGKGAVPKQPKPQRESNPRDSDSMEKQESNPGIILVVRSDIVLQTINNQQMTKEAINGKIVKYAITNTSCHPEIIKSQVRAGKYDLTKVRRVCLALEHFKQIKVGGIYNLDNILKLERK